MDIMKKFIDTTVCIIKGKEVQIAYGWSEDNIVIYGEGNKVNASKTSQMSGC